MSKGLGARESTIYSENCTLSSFARAGLGEKWKMGLQRGQQDPGPREMAHHAEKVGNGAMQTDLMIN